MRGRVMCAYALRLPLLLSLPHNSSVHFSCFSSTTTQQTSEKAAAEAFELGKKLHEATLLNQLLSRRSGAVGGGGGGGNALAPFHLSVPAKLEAAVNTKAGEKQGKDEGGGLARTTPPVKGGAKTTRGVGGKRPRSAASESEREQGEQGKKGPGGVGASSNGNSGSGKSSDKGGGADVWEDEGGGVFGFADHMAPLVVEAPSTATRTGDVRFACFVCLNCGAVRALNMPGLCTISISVF